MRKFFKFSLCVALIAIFFSSCGGDSADKYVGTWDYTATGELHLLSGGQPLMEIPLADQGTSVVTKISENTISIDGQVFTISGKTLTAEPASANQTVEGATMAISATFEGNCSKNEMNVNAKMSGTWSAYGVSGTITGSSETKYTNHRK